jgi:hypothetical protein
VRLILCFLLTTLFAFAEEQQDVFKEHNIMVLPSGEVHQGNYFAMGKSVEISGTVNGDVYALAGEVVIDGVVNGDVLVCGGSVDIGGKVAQNCRLLGGQVLISGTVGNNVTAISGNLQLLPSATIGGSLVATAANVDLAAHVGSEASIVASNLRLSAHLDKGLDAYVGQIRITSKAVIKEGVEYKSGSTAWIEPGASIGGAVVRNPSFVHELVEGTWVHSLLLGSKVLAILMNFIYTFVVGVLLVKLFPKNLEAALDALHKTPGKSLLFGLMLLVLLPLASLILLMTILGVPFALTLIAANIIGFYTAKIYSIFWVSNALFKKIGVKTNPFLRLFCGLVIYFILTAIPILGFLVAFAAMLFGLGSGILAQGKRGILSTH